MMIREVKIKASQVDYGPGCSRCLQEDRFKAQEVLFEDSSQERSQCGDSGSGQKDSVLTPPSNDESRDL